MKLSVTVGVQLLWSVRYSCNKWSRWLRHGGAKNKAVSRWLCISVTWPVTCASHIPCTHTPEIIDMHRDMCDRELFNQLYFTGMFPYTEPLHSPMLCYMAAKSIHNLWQKMNNAIYPQLLCHTSKQRRCYRFGWFINLCHFSSSTIVASCTPKSSWYFSRNIHAKSQSLSHIKISVTQPIQ